MISTPLRGVVTASKSRRRRGGKIFIYWRVMQENVGDTSRKSSRVKLCRRGSAGKRRPPSPKWKEEVKFSFEFGGSSGRDTGLVLQARPSPMTCLVGEKWLYSALCLSLRLQVKSQRAARRSPEEM